MTDRIVIAGAARTPVGAFLGDLKTVPVQELARIAGEEAVKRSGIDKNEIDEVIFGHVISSADVGNLGRHVGLLMELPHESTGMTVNRICGSGLQALVSAYQSIKLQDAKVVLAGGAESLSRIPYYLPLSARYQGFTIGNATLLDSDNEHHKNTQPQSIYPDIKHMGNTAENVAKKYQISRLAQDEFAYHSQMKAKNAIESGRMAQEIVAVEIKDRKGNVKVVDQDGHPRFSTTVESLSKLKPAFDKLEGSVTAGNSSGINDGAAAMIVMNESTAKEKNLEPMAYINDYQISGCDPRLMGMGPVPAIQTLLKRNNLTLQDIDYLEINEAFAAQTLGCLIELGNTPGTELYSRFNVNGGACVLGHPLGMSGARITVSLCYEFKNNPQARYAIASACIGGGQGIAVLLENPLYGRGENN